MVSATRTSGRIAAGIAQIGETLRFLVQLGFNIEKTPLLHESRNADTPIAGLSIVFTGKMKQGSREAMQIRARRLGAIVQSTVGSTTPSIGLRRQGWTSQNGQSGAVGRQSDLGK
jgi:DNA ligase (NAD+)